MSTENENNLCEGSSYDIANLTDEGFLYKTHIVKIFNAVRVIWLMRKNVFTYASNFYKESINRQLLPEHAQIVQEVINTFMTKSPVTDFTNVAGFAEVIAYAEHYKLSSINRIDDHVKQFYAQYKRLFTEGLISTDRYLDNYEITTSAREQTLNHQIADMADMTFGIKRVSGFSCLSPDTRATLRTQRQLDNITAQNLTITGLITEK
jgi:hypothetical protein